MPLPKMTRRVAENAITGAAPQSLTTTERIRLDPRPDFMLSVSPESYELSEIDGEPVYLPTVQKHDRSPGVNGVDARGGISALRTNINMRGSVLVEVGQCPPEFTPDGRPGYLRQYDGVAGSVSLECWQTVVKAPGNKHVAQLTRDNETLYRRWRLWLMESGIVPFPTEDWIERYEERLGERADRRAQQASAPEVKAARATEAAETLTKARRARSKISDEVSDG